MSRRAELVAVLRRDGPLPAPGPGSRRGAASGRFGLPVVLAGLAVLLVAAVGFALATGSVAVPWSQTWRILAHRLGGPALVPDPDWTRAQDLIVADTRLPRVLLAALVGATLTVAGMVLQAVVRNPLAGPGIIGVSAGAATGAVVVMRFGLLGAGALTLNVAAFGGALVTLAVVLTIARSAGRITVLRLILGGVAVGSVLSALTSLLVLTAPNPMLASQVLFWTLGGFGSARWDLLVVPAVVLVAGLFLLVARARELDLLLAGDESAGALGVDVHRFRRRVFVVVAVLVGVTVAVSGVIGFVGLMLPHVVRFLVGSAHRRALPVAVLVGAVFTVLADLVARTVISPEEIPVGIVTALVGGPFFVWLLRRDGRREVAR
ncbi:MULTISPECIES: FecCD family ABC transporter permease [Pseudonocardia]|uniref:Hemin transport system permease protein HmuU n=2 Tax=Pseudonocardia TaxID=1847 RepID=A0A1Y2NAZ0_PSEAH|nr:MULTISPECIES: iron ABC transporter permease [Pseudonocardia]OSY44068.1 Hemin transport system permease protein HmuU [Pseudonocardia autotrophica]TDN74202.1 iron complex transport system permease protein [Pseudonocardia autotrophica]BBG04962.1 ABC transporter permease [Pseudonocardia autotrophica]GEC23618.1 ABC transporter permease [Pseudonocardia saturnea]